MTRAIIETATGRVVGVIVIEPDADGGYDHWSCPDGCEIIDSLGIAGPGDIWDGSNFTRSTPPRPRLEVLMSEGPATQVYNEATDEMLDRPAEDIAADKAELLGLLQTKLAETEDLTWDQMNKMLALERES